MKKHLSKIKQVTIACAISMIIYMLTYWIISAFMKEASGPLYLLVLAIYSLVFMSVFNLILIRRTYIKNYVGEKSVGEKIALQDFKNGYWGFKTDIIFLFKRELSTLVAFALINSASWIMISIDKLIFSKRTITAILLLYAPLNIVGITLPEWANGILGYLLGTILCFAIYLLELVVFRKKWYIHWNEPRR